MRAACTLPLLGLLVIARTCAVARSPNLFLGQVPDSALPAQPAQLPPHLPVPPPAAHTLSMKDCPITDAGLAHVRGYAVGARLPKPLRRGYRTVGGCDPFWALNPGATHTTPVCSITGEGLAHLQGVHTLGMKDCPTSQTLASPMCVVYEPCGCEIAQTLKGAKQSTF